MGKYDDFILAQPGLVAYWPMDDENFVQELVDYKSALNAQKVGAGNPLFRQPGPSVALETLKPDMAEHWEAPYDARLNTPAMTFEMWTNFEPPIPNANHGIAGENAAAKGWNLWLSTPPVKFTAAFNEVVGSPLQSAVVMPGVWRLVSLTHDGTTGKLYVDGVLKDSAVLAYTPQLASTLWLTLDPLHPSDQQDGYYGGAALFDRALTAGELLTHFTAGMNEAAFTSVGLSVQQQPAKATDVGLQLKHVVGASVGLQVYVPGGTYRGTITTTERNALSPAPVEGDSIDNVTTGYEEWYDGSVWIQAALVVRPERSVAKRQLVNGDPLLFVKSSLDFQGVPVPSTPVTPAAGHHQLYPVLDQGKRFLQTIDEGGDIARVNRDFYILVQNNTGATLTRGTAVYLTGTDGASYPRAAKAKADSLTTSSADGLMLDTVTTGNYGRMQVHGRMTGLDTSALTVGQHVYLSPTTAGGLTSTPPVSPNLRNIVAFALKSNASTGELLVLHEQDLSAQALGVLQGIVSGVSYTKTTPNGTDMAEASLMQILIPASRFGVNFTIEAYMQGVVTVNSNQPSLDLRWRAGINPTLTSDAQVALLPTFTSNSTTNAGWVARGLFTVRSTGVGGTCIAELEYFTEMNSQFSFGMELSNQTTTTAIDTTVDNYIGLSADWSAGGTGHVLTVTNAYIKALTLGT